MPLNRMYAPGIIKSGGGRVKSGTPSDDAVPAGFISPEDHGAAADGVTDDSDALSLAIGGGAPMWLQPKTYRITETAMVSASCHGIWNWGGEILYDGAHTQPAVQVGVNTDKGSFIRLMGLRIVSNAQSDWSNDEHVGLRTKNASVWFWELRRIRGFARGVHVNPETDGSNKSWAYGVGELGSIENCQVGMDWDSTSNNGWDNENLLLGGCISCNVNPTLDRIGLRTWSANGLYPQANHKVFVGTSFRLGAAAASGTATAWWTSNFYNELRGVSYRDADILMHNEEQGTGSTGSFHVAACGYSPARLEARDRAVTNTPSASGMIDLRSLLDGAAVSNLMDIGGVIS